MKNIIRVIAVLILATRGACCAEPAAQQFLRYIYGADDIKLAKICHPSEDSWMLRGPKNASALGAIEARNFDPRPAGVISGMIGTEMYFIELRNGKVDPAFSLAGVYYAQNQVIMGFLSSALSRNDRMLGRLTTNPGRVRIIGPKAAPGDMDQYSSVIEMMPVVRSSKPADDARSKTVTYRVPLGDDVLSLTLVRDGVLWKIDTSKTVSVPLEFFFR